LLKWIFQNYHWQPDWTFVAFVLTSCSKIVCQNKFVKKYSISTICIFAAILNNAIKREKGISHLSQKFTKKMHMSQFETTVCFYSLSLTRDTKSYWQNKHDSCSAQIRLIEKTQIWICLLKTWDELPRAFLLSDISKNTLKDKHININSILLYLLYINVFYESPLFIKANWKKSRKKRIRKLHLNFCSLFIRSISSIRSRTYFLL
jgi:hypothetical protein